MIYNLYINVMFTMFVKSKNTELYLSLRITPPAFKFLYPTLNNILTYTTIYISEVNSWYLLLLLICMINFFTITKADL